MKTYMIFATPKLSQADVDVLGLIKEQREELRYAVAQNQNRWTGFLRRTTFVRALQGSNTIVRGAMAQLNLTMIHPFKDGNGRMARALQTLVMARGGILSPIFSSIEEWLGRNTDAYYNILGEVGQGSWNPQYDAAPWVRF